MPRPFLSGLLSVVLPGAGQMYAGRVARGAAIILAVVSVVALLTGLVARSGASLADEIVSLDVLLGLFVANAVVLVVRFWIVADAYGVAARARRRALGRSRPIVAGVSLVFLAFLTAAPHALLGWGTYLTYDTIETVFAEEEPGDVLSLEVLAASQTVWPSGTGEALLGDRPVAPPEPEPTSRSRSRRSGTGRRSS